MHTIDVGNKRIALGIDECVNISAQQIRNQLLPFLQHKEKPRVAKD